MRKNILAVLLMLSVCSVNVSPVLALNKIEKAKVEASEEAPKKLTRAEKKALKESKKAIKEVFQDSEDKDQSPRANIVLSTSEVLNIQ